MNKIELYYKNYKLGTLSFENGNYIYNSTENDSDLKEKFIGLLNYNLTNSKNKKSKTLFNFFKVYFLDKILNKPDLLKILNKQKTDNEFDILLAFSKLKQDDVSFSLIYKRSEDFE